jgi:hypothetical protein
LLKQFISVRDTTSGRENFVGPSTGHSQLSSISLLLEIFGAFGDQTESEVVGAKKTAEIFHVSETPVVPFLLKKSNSNFEDNNIYAVFN